MAFKTIRLGVRLVAVVCLVVAVAASGLRGQTPQSSPTSAPTTTVAGGKATTAQAPAHQVYAGVYVNQIKLIDLKNNNFVVDFWLWFRWKGPKEGEGAIKPLDSFEIVGGHVESKENEIHDVVKEYNYAACRVTATVTKFFDISRFPLDAHTLALNIEDSELEEDRLVYLADVENSGLSGEVQVPGWQIKKSQAHVASNEYSTNYGNIALATGNKSVYSRFLFEIDLVRPGVGYFFKLFWSLFLATVIALLALLIDPIDLDPRFGLGVGAIFAAIASAYIISSALPETNQYTLADKMNMLAVGVIFASILQSVISLHIWKSGNEAGSKRLDRLSFGGMLGFYVVAAALIVII